MAGIKLLTCLAALGLPSLGLAQATPEDVESILGPIEPLSIETGRYIVRFSDAGSARFRKPDGSLDASSFFSILDETAPDITPVTTFDSALFHGASFDLANGTTDAIKELENLSEVESIWPAAIFTIPETTRRQAVAMSEIPAWSAHNDTNLAEAHARGYRGEGAVIAIVDSGVDYTHPALGGGFGPGFKVEAGHDFVGDDWEPSLPYAPDDDPQDCDGHGTHVAGIVAGDFDAVPGVAPAARLRAYTVFGCGAGTFEDVIMAAFLRAHEEGADVINASLGSDRGFPDSPLAVVAAVIQAAGNSGSAGAFFMSSGGNVLDGTTVGSIDHDELVGYVATATSDSGETREIIHLTYDSLQWNCNGTLPGAVAPDYDACDLATVPTVRNALLVSPRGRCTWPIHDLGIIDQVEYVLYYNFEGSPYSRPDRVFLPGAARELGLISYEDGTWVTSQYEQGHTVSFHFVHDQRPVGISVESYAGGRVSPFSSWGPTLDARMKPDISAPGGEIFSTYPVNSGSWAVLSGTSMATPYIAGVAGLYLAARGGRDVLGVEAANIARKRIVASGQPVRHSDGTDNLGSVAQQGAGLVDALKVLESTIDVSPASINLNDTVNFKPEHAITIINQGDQTAIFRVHHDPGVTTHARSTADAWIRGNPPYSTGEGNVGSVEISASEFTLAAGESASLTATFAEPPNIDANMLPIYGGGIVITSDRGQVSRVTYMGIKGSLYAADTWELERGVPLFLTQIGNFVPFLDGSTFTFEGGTVPMALYSVLFSTRELSFEFVARDWNESDWAYPVVPDQNKVKGALITTPHPWMTRSPASPSKTTPARRTASTSSRRMSLPTASLSPPVSTGCSAARSAPLATRTASTTGSGSSRRGSRSRARDRQTTAPPPATPTSTSSVLAVQPTRPCNGSTRRIDIKARVGDDGELRGLYRYSDLLAVDLGTANRTLLDVELDGAGHVVTPDLPDVAGNRFLSTHSNPFVSTYSNPNSLVEWSYLDCSVVCGNRLKCVSADKAALYECDTNEGVVRSGPTVRDGCRKLHLFVEQLECPEAPALPSATP